MNLPKDMYWHLKVLTVFLLSLGLASGAAPSTCQVCLDRQTCMPPDCFCCRDEMQLPMTVNDIPQIVFFTFDDALTDQVAGFYDQLFDTSRKNPNGCPISMTMFISHNNTKYHQVNKFYKKGMEIAAHSVTHNHMNEANFYNEARLQKQNLASLGGIPERDIVGWRSPYLEPVGDLQPDKLKELGYVYDSTLTFSKRKLNNKVPTPFTLDFGWPYTCQVKPCPNREHTGFWEVPIVSLIDYKHKYDCVYVDGCMNAPPDENSAYKFLKDNFDSYYSKSRIPFGINMHPSWFYYPDRLKAMDRFILELANRKDVYILSIKQMIAWLKNPVALSDIHSFKPWSCSTASSGSSFARGTSSGFNQNTNGLPHQGIKKIVPSHVNTLKSWQQKFTESGRHQAIRKITIPQRVNKISQWRGTIQNGVLRLPTVNRISWRQRQQNLRRNQIRTQPVTSPTISSVVNFNPVQNNVVRHTAITNPTQRPWTRPTWQQRTVTPRKVIDNSNSGWWSQPPQINPAPLHVPSQNIPLVTTTPVIQNPPTFEQQQLSLLEQQEQKHTRQQQQEQQQLQQNQMELNRQLELQRLAENQRVQQEQERQRQLKLEVERKEQLALQESLRKEADRRKRLREERLLKNQRRRQQQALQTRKQNNQNTRTVNNVSSTRRAIEIWQRFVKFLTGKI
ncbi:hypothetical protein KUTeg_022613 [Tegillarca granosa]|uniref:NodB homology domain-containing protein n=1 Tax=Tegillarca granosa TaxID=220873 RepID=A0ABQ9E606_TEGGR|nr:hypothetical protein KUTeg_022613 [Tegillarca granosa]